jgi:hypothetical protein
MKNKGHFLKIGYMKPLIVFITFVILAFSMQYTIVNLIIGDDTIAQNLLQNPFSEEEEEEEKANESKDFQLFQTHDQLFLLSSNEKANLYFTTINICYENNYIKTLNQPPECNL